MNIKIKFFNDRNIAYSNPLRTKLNYPISHPKDDDSEIINNFLINDSIDTQFTHKKHF